MKQSNLKGLGHLNAYQIAAASLVTSTVAALAVLFSLRRWVFRRAPAPSGPGAARSAGENQHGTMPPNHFSESLLVPGITHTGTEILEEDNRAGRSPEGV